MAKNNFEQEGSPDGSRQQDGFRLVIAKGDEQASLTVGLVAARVGELERMGRWDGMGGCGAMMVEGGEARRGEKGRSVEEEVAAMWFRWWAVTLMGRVRAAQDMQVIPLSTPLR